MSYLAFNAAPIQYDNKNTSGIDKKRNTRNKTIKKYNQNDNRVAEMINQIHKSSLLNEDEDDNDNDNIKNMGDFDLPNPESMGSQRKSETEVKSFPKPQDNSQGKWQEANWQQTTNMYSPYQQQQPIQTQVNNNSVGDESVNIDGFKNLEHNSNSDIGNSPFLQNIPYYNQMGLGGTVQNRDELLTKLNYMIHILEEQKDQKTGHVTEEVVLYSFLGIFIIFIVDSFARAGKYVR